jgi:golgi to ER traffic protein 4
MVGKAEKKIESTVARIRQAVSEGPIDKEKAYEVGQELRRLVARCPPHYWSTAIDTIYDVSQAILKAGLGGEGGDLAVLLIDVYKQAQLKPDAASRGKVLALLRLFASDEPTRKKFITEMIE